MINKFWACLVILLISAPAAAQNTGGVFPPFVNPSTHILQYRIAVDPDDAMGDTSIAQRLHYINAINDDRQIVVYAGVRQTEQSDFDFDYFHAGYAFDLGEDGQKFRNGIRFDVRLRDANRPNHIGFNWMNQYAFDNGWNARTVVLTNVQFGDNARDGVFIHSRTQLAKRFESGHLFGLEMYNFYGNTKKLGNFDSQNHSLGPIYSFPIAPKWSIFTGALFGISDAAPDTQLRFWLNRSL